MDNTIDESISKLGTLLYKNFFFNNQAYAIQERVHGEVKFFTKHNRIDANKISYYIENKKSVLSYQQRFDKLKWICLDFDILKSTLKEIDDFDFINDNKYKPMLLEEVKMTCSYLESKRIEYVVEYSGNRGIHIWIFFKEEISKKIGYTIIEKIINDVQFKYINSPETPIAIDIFPKVPDARNNKLGKGVKIPLSYHLKSEKYSYILDEDFEITGVNDLDIEFLEQQIYLLEQIKYNDIMHIIDVLSIEQISEFKLYEKVIGCFTDNIDINRVIEMLSKSDLYKYLFNKEISSLNEEERKIIVGTFIRLETKTDKNFGIGLLKEIFSKDENYNEQLTETKINLLKNLYPPNIEHLEMILKFKCEYCANKNIKNSIELLENISIRKTDDLLSTVKWATNAECNYLQSNDEVPLCFIKDEINSLDTNNVKDIVNEILVKGNYYYPKYYEYKRLEDKEKKKIRTLYSLSGKDRVITTTLMKYIHDIVGFDNISPISYSYRINSKSSNNIFINWNLLWLDFTKAIHSFTDHPSYNKYYVIRMDIKQFYDSINLTLLKEILQSKSRHTNNKLLELTMAKLDEDSRIKFRNATNYLINTCRSFGDKGVPQGPAFARYLAEIYLTSIDNYLVNNLDMMFDFACRYVDDYYIFIKDVEKGQRIKDSLQGELGKIYLSTNSKFTYGILEDIKHEIISKNQIEKYFIDGIDKSTSENVKEKAVLLLNKMFKDLDSIENVKDFPFFLTHLFDENYLKLISPNLIEKVACLEVGRGILFKHFYNNVAIKYSDLGFYKNVSGLSRSNLITAISNANYEDFNVTDIANYHLNLSLFEYERRELIRFLLVSGIHVDVSLLVEDDYSLILQLLHSIPRVKWNDVILNNSLEKIQDIEDKVEALILLEKILSVSENMPKNNKLVELIYSITYENFESIKNEINVQILFNLVAYSTLYIDSEIRIRALWTNLLSISEGRFVEENKWLKFSKLINLNKICINTVITFLVMTFKKISKIDGCIAKEHEENYAMYLFLYLNNMNTIQKKDNKDLYELVLTVADQNNIEFLTWCCNDAKYLLDPEVSVKNIEINDRVILKLNAEILVRGPREIFDNEDGVLEESWSSEVSKFYKIYSCNGILEDFHSKIENYDLMDTFVFCNKLIKELKNTNLVNIFERGSLISSNDKINFKYSYRDKMFVIDKEQMIECNIDSVIDMIINVIKNSNVKTINVLPDKVLEPQNILTEIIPDCLLNKKIKARNQYFIEFCNLISNAKSANCTLNIFELEKIKIQALSTCLDNFDSRFSSSIKILSKNFRTLYLYNAFYNNDYENYHLYSSNKANFETLSGALSAFMKSISKNLDFDYIINLLKELKMHIRSFSEKVGDLDNFKLVEVKVHSRYKKIDIDGISMDPSDFEYVIFDGQFDRFELSEQELLSITDEDYLYLNNNVLVKLPEVYNRSFEIIKNKGDSNDLEKYIEKLSIRNEHFYKQAVEVILKQCGDEIERVVAEGRIIKLLEGTDEKFHAYVLEVIAKHRVIEEKELNKFISILESKLYDSQTTVMPLKDFDVDKNGLYVILRDGYKSRFDRKSPLQESLTRSTESFMKGEAKEIIVFLSDVGISGRQVETVLDYHIRIKEGDKYSTSKYYKYNNDVLEKNIHNSKKIVFLNCYFTNLYEEKVREYMVKRFNYNKESILFEGKKIENYYDYCFCSLHERTRKGFISFIKDYKADLLDKQVYGRMTYKEYLDLCEKGTNLEDKDLSKTLMLLRYKSLPKYHNLLLRDTIFNYRKDK